AATSREYSLAPLEQRRPYGHDKLATAAAINPAYRTSVPSSVKGLVAAEKREGCLLREATTSGGRMKLLDQCKDIAFSLDYSFEGRVEMLDIGHTEQGWRLRGAKMRAEGHQSIVQSTHDQCVLVSFLAVGQQRLPKSAVFVVIGAPSRRPSEAVRPHCPSI